MQSYDELVPDAQARLEVGGVSEMTFWRYDNIPGKAPPGWPPAVKMNRRNFRSRKQLEAFKTGLFAAAASRSAS
jgi:hypothetical protein